MAGLKVSAHISDYVLHFPRYKRFCFSFAKKNMSLKGLHIRMCHRIRAKVFVCTLFCSFVYMYDHFLDMINLSLCAMLNASKLNNSKYVIFKIVSNSINFNFKIMLIRFLKINSTYFLHFWKDKRNEKPKETYWKFLFSIVFW